jgi:hypothetical protein
MLFLEARSRPARAPPALTSKPRTVVRRILIGQSCEKISCSENQKSVQIKNEEDVVEETKIVCGRVFIFMAQAKSKLIQLSKSGRLRLAVVCGQLMERRCEGVE